MNESLEIPFGGQSRMGQRNHILDVGLDPAWDGALRWHAEPLKSIGRFSGAWGWIAHKQVCITCDAGYCSHYCSSLLTCRFAVNKQILLLLDDLKDAVVAMMMRKEEVEEQMKYVLYIYFRIFKNQF